MVHWLTRFKSINRAVEQAHGWIALFGAIGVVFGFLATAMTWVASSITALSQYGWGVPVFTGIAASLVVILGLSHAAVPAARAWRHMFPVAPAPPPLPIFATKEAPAPANDLEDKISDLKQSVGTTTDDVVRHVVRLDSRDDDLAENTKSVLGLVEKLNERVLEFRDKLIEIGADSIRNADQIKKLRSEELPSLQSDSAGLKRTFARLLDALHARDNLAQFKQNDEIVWNLGRKLLKINPCQYEDGDEWLDDYRPWREALSAIDLAKGALGNRNRPFLDISPAELEACYEDPPSQVGENGNTLVPYKIVSLAFTQYERYRQQMTKFFEMRAALPSSSDIP